jgi:hypothetical protein
MREAARQLQREGVKTCWLRATGDGKVPIHKDWQLGGVTVDQYAPGNNLAMVCGAVSGNRVVVDIDDASLLDRAKTVLPPTGRVEGRPGKPGSHYHYEIVGDIPPEMTSSASGLGGPRIWHFRHPETGASLLDFLGTGAQVVVPPSVHSKSGQTRVWENRGQPGKVDITELMKAIYTLLEPTGWKPPGPKAVNTGAAPRHRGPGTAASNGHWKAVSMDVRVERCRAYLLAVEPAVSGQNGHDKTFRVAITRSLK